MAYIYTGQFSFCRGGLLEDRPQVYCDQCAEQIKNSIVWEQNPGKPINLSVWERENGFTRDNDCDPADYPKYRDDKEEANWPLYCASQEGCVNREPYDANIDTDQWGTWWLGHFFGNLLTSKGYDTVKDAVERMLLSGDLDYSPHKRWFEHYNWIEFEDNNDKHRH